MARKLSMILFAALATVALLQSSAEAATYFVGDSSNWVIPSSANAYSDWAANKTFAVGDILVFNFLPNNHDVAEVTKAAYDGCNGANPISLQTSSPANITLRTAGEHYYICTFSGHCTNGQKLAINVTGASSPAPQPSSSSPSPSPAPSTPTPVPAPAPAPKASSPSPSSSSSPPAPSTATPPSSTGATPPSSTGATPPSSTGATPPSSTGPTNSPPPTTPTTSSPPPENSSASSLGVAGLSATFLSAVALALWY